MTVLIVDDSPRVREVIRAVVEDVAEAVSECSDGIEALDAYNRFRPDWVLMDLGMKKMDGISATEQIKKEHPEARIIIVTDYGDPFFRKAADEAGAFAFVLKENLTSLLDILTQQQSK